MNQNEINRVLLSGRLTSDPEVLEMWSGRLSACCAWRV
jgi:single-stranded DNA-binding protein